MKNLMNTYGAPELLISHGSGAWLYDQTGDKYLDALSGIAVCGLGHSHPAISEAIALQSEQLVHCSNFFATSNQQILSKKICDISGMSNAFFCNSGAEANETAIKIARMYGRNKGIEIPTILVTSNAFHGRTLAAISASGAKKVQVGFEPLLTGFERVNFNDIHAVKNIAKENKSICAVFVEPIQGEGGINIPDDNYLNELEKICKENNWLFMLDEVQTGNGRTGAYFCYQHNKVQPDVVTTSKGLGNGFPIGACLASGLASDILQPGSHGSTFGGNPLACAAAIATIDSIYSEDILINAKNIGQRIVDSLSSTLANVTAVKSIRGMGCMIGIELDRPCKNLFSIGIKNKIIINVTAENIIRLLPPLIYSEEEADHLTNTLSGMIKSYSEQS